MAQSRERLTQAQAETDLYFGPFRLEQAKRLWRGEQLIEVRPRPLAVLRYLAERPGQLLTSEELLKRVWPGTYVTRIVLRVCVRELRQALDDDLAAPQFIETVGRQGYRFIAPITTTPPVFSSQFSVPSAKSADRVPQLTPDNWKLTTPFVGREQELGRLQEFFARARRGERQLVFASGEPGIGKTALVDCFLDQVQTSGSVRIGRGQCIEHYGSGEAYLPILEALGQLCREPGGEQMVAVLRRHAPSWLAQLAGVVAAEEREALRRDLQGRSQEHMLLELAGILEAVATDAVLVLVVEDLQWSDVSTLDALAYLARRRHPAQLYILGTYRPVEVMLREHPLRRVVQDLSGRKLCQELALELLTEAEVEEYLRQRFGRSAALTELSQMIYRRTDGNALFMVSFVDYLLRQGLIAAAGSQLEVRADLPTLHTLVPNSLQQVMLRQIESLAADEQQLLEVASVSGMTFTAAETAGVVERPLEEIEEVYDHLTRRKQLIAEAGIAEWPDGTVTVQYEFRHALCQQVVYEQLGHGRRVRLHRQIGEWKEGRYGTRAAEIAGELAMHFTAGRDPHRAAQYYGQVGEIALRRSACREASEHCKKGLDLLERLPDTLERQRQELSLRMLLSAALMVTQGFVAEGIRQNLARARELCHALHDDATLVPVLVGLGRSYDARADREAIEQLMEEERRLLERIPEPRLALQLHTHLGTSSMVRGALVQARQHHARVLELYNPQWHRELVLQFGIDPAVVAGVASSWSLWLTGWPDQARARGRSALSRARELGHPFSLTLALVDAARVPLWCGNLDEAERLVEEGLSLARELGAWFLRAGSMVQGMIWVQRGEAEAGLSLLTEGVAQYRSTEVLYLLPLYLAFMADAYRQLGRTDEGLTTVAEALHLTETHASLFWAAELPRLKGELTLQQSRTSLDQVQGKFRTRQKSKSKRLKQSSVRSAQVSVPGPQPSTLHTQAEAEAEACFHKALKIVRQQEAKSLELRAAMSLSRLWQQQGKRAEARTLLAEIYGWFTEGFDTQDLREAKALLDTLGV